ncbi:hypothetical protein ES703_109173 [subsurface metagenome]
MKEFPNRVTAVQLEDITAGELASGMEELSRMGVTLADVKTALRGIDKTAMKREALSRIKVKVWEEGDLVNGIDLRQHPNPTQRERIVKNLDAGGNIYFVFIDGKLVYNQWHIRSEGLAPIPNARLQEVVDDHVLDIAQGLFNAAVRREMLKKL